MNISLMFSYEEFNNPTDFSISFLRRLSSPEISTFPARRAKQCGRAGRFT